MRLSARSLGNAADGLLAVALLGGELTGPLAAYADAAGADGATLVRHDPTDRAAPARRSGCLIATAPIAPIVERYLRGEAPPDPRLIRVSPGLGEGFIGDHDRFTPEEIARDPFYQEFLRPEGLRWHGCARLAGAARAPQVYLSLKRRTDRGHYAPEDLGALGRTLPKLRAAAAVAAAISGAAMRGYADAVADRGVALFELDRQGRVLRAGAAAQALPPSALRVRGRRLETTLREEQARLDVAVGQAAGPARRPGLAMLSTGSDGVRVLARTLPVVGVAQEVLCGVAAVVLVSVLARPSAPPPDLVRTLRAGFALTAAEARVATLVGLGDAPEAAARKLSLSPGTARNYLKAAFAKTGTGRQASLAALVAALAR